MVDELNLKEFLADRGIQFEFYVMKHDVYGILYEPVHQNEKSGICILLMHSNANYLTHDVCLMAGYGYRVLCVNVSDENRSLDTRILEAKAAVSFLRGYPGVEKIVLWGHSGGATLLSAYQMLAENGVACCQGPEKIHKCPNALAGMPAADGILFIDANWGNSAMMMFSIDPAVTSEDGSSPCDSKLDLFHPDNGFVPDASQYPREFIHRFQKAQGERSNRLIDRALSRLECIKNGSAFLQDDEPFVVIGAAQGFLNNKLFAQDTRLLSHTRKSWPLIHADGSITEEMIYSVRKPTNNCSFTRSFYEGALFTTVRRFLAEYAIRTTPEYGYNEDSVTGIDWSSTYSSPIGNVEFIKVPTLVMGMTGGWEYIASETIYERSGSSDKALAFVEGAGHLYNTATECEEYPGQFGDTLHTIFNYVDSWLSVQGRFL